jgi:hypothetical protein
MFRPPTAAIEPPEHYSWAELMHRMFSVDVLECGACGSRIRIVSAIHPPEAIRQSLDCLGIPSGPTDCAGIAHPGVIGQSAEWSATSQQ